MVNKTKNEMENRYFIVEAFAEGDIDLGLSNEAMTHDELLKKYMETFIDYMTSEIIAQMSDEELEDEINMWECNLDESDEGYMKSVEVYQINMKTFNISRYEIPTHKMVEYVRQWSDEQ